MVSTVSSSQAATTAASAPTANSAGVVTIELDKDVFRELLDVVAESTGDVSRLSSALASARQEVDSGAAWRRLFVSPFSYATEGSARQDGVATEAVATDEDAGKSDAVSGRVTYPEVAGALAEFKPSFLPVVGMCVDGTTQTLNPRQFASKETAEQLAKALGANGVIELTLDGPFHWSEPQYQLDFGEVQLNAGLVADLYRKYPKDLADALVGREIACARGTAAAQDMPTAAVAFGATPPTFSGKAGAYGTVGDYRLNSVFEGLPES